MYWDLHSFSVSRFVCCSCTPAAVASILIAAPLRANAQQSLEDRTPRCSAAADAALDRMISAYRKIRSLNCTFSERDGEGYFTRSNIAVELPDTASVVTRTPRGLCAGVATGTEHWYVPVTKTEVLPFKIPEHSGNVRAALRFGLADRQGILATLLMTQNPKHFILSAVRWCDYGITSKKGRYPDGLLHFYMQDGTECRLLLDGRDLLIRKIVFSSKPSGSKATEIYAATFENLVVNDAKSTRAPSIDRTRLLEYARRYDGGLPAKGEAMAAQKPDPPKPIQAGATTHSSPETAGPFAANEISFSAGEVNLLDSKVLDHTFIVTNKTKSPVQISAIAPTCECTQVSIQDDRSDIGVPSMHFTGVELKPGQMLRIVTSVDLSLVPPGPFSRVVLIQSDGAEPIAKLTIGGRLTNGIRFSPDIVELGPVSKHGIVAHKLIANVDRRLLGTDYTSLEVVSLDGAVTPIPERKPSNIRDMQSEPQWIDVPVSFAVRRNSVPGPFVTRVAAKLRSKDGTPSQVIETDVVVTGEILR